MTVHEQMCTAVGLQAVAKEWWDCEVPLDLADKLSADYTKQSRERVKQDTEKGMLITAAGPLIWLKMWLNVNNLLPVSGSPPADDKPTATTATFHVGFLTLAETEAMLERLQNESKSTNVNSPARSKMFDTAQKQTVTPINATAGIVAHTPRQ